MSTNEGGGNNVPTVESKENAPVENVLISYRDNDMFDWGVPLIKNILETAGKRVILKPFPRGATTQEITASFEKEGRELDTQLASAKVVTDMTVGMTLRRMNLSDKASESVRFGVGQLELPFRKAAAQFAKSHVAEAGFDASDTMSKENTAKGIAFFMGRIKEVVENTPARIVILSDKMADHAPFYLRGDKNRSSLSPNELETWEKDAAEEIAGWVAAAGISAERITIMTLREFQANQNFAGKTFVIADRHNYDVEKLNVPLFKMPIETMITDAFFSGAISSQEDLAAFQGDIEKNVKSIFDIGNGE